MAKWGGRARGVICFDDAWLPLRPLAPLHLGKIFQTDR